MTRILLFLLVALPIPTLAVAQEFAAPSSMVGFLQPGMKLGIRSTEGSSDIHIVIFSERAFAIERDGRLMELAAIVEKYPEVAEAKDAALRAGPKSYVDGRGRLIELGVPSVERLSIDRRLLLCSVSHIGADYMLVTLEESADNGDAQSPRKVYAIDRIASIVWRERPQLALSYRPIEREPDRSQP